MKKILLDLEPFGVKINPTWEAVKALPETIGDTGVIKLHVPVEFGVGAQKVIDVLEAGVPRLCCVDQRAEEAEDYARICGYQLGACAYSRQRG